MGRKKKSVLNQIVETPKEEVKVEVVEEQQMGVTEDGTAIHPDNFPKEEVSLKDSGASVAEEISLKVSGEKLAEVIKEKEVVETVTNEEETEDPVVEGIVITKPSKEQLLRLSKSGLRWYQRTGKLPK